MSIEKARQKAHKAIDQLFEALEEGLRIAAKGGAVEPTSNPPRDADLEQHIAAALVRNGKRAPRERAHELTDLDRKIVMAVYRRTADAKWQETSKVLQANLKLTRQQVAGIVAAATRASAAGSAN